MSNICWLFVKKLKKTDSPIKDESVFRNLFIDYFSFLIAAWAAANLATGTL